MVPSTLTYAEGHPNQHETINLGDYKSKPYIISFDTKSLTLQDFKSFEEGIDTLIFKGILINTAESFVNNYLRDLDQLVQYSLPRIQKQKAGRPIIDPQTAANLGSRALSRFEDFALRVARWEGFGDITILLPYAEVATKDNPLIGQPPEIDDTACHPFLNGILFTGVLNKEA